MIITIVLILLSLSVSIGVWYKLKYTKPKDTKPKEPVYDRVNGFLRIDGIVNGDRSATPEECRMKGLENADYLAWGQRTADHPDAEYKGTCFYYTKFGPYKGDPDNKAHITGCFQEGQKVIEGCITPA